MQQVLAESLLIAALGSAAALAVAMVVSRSIPPLISTTVDRDASRSRRSTGGCSASRRSSASRRRCCCWLRAGAARRRATACSARPEPRQRRRCGPGRIRRVLVSLQIAVTLVLLFGGLLFLRTFRNLATQDHGVSSDGVVIANVFFPRTDFRTRGRVAGLSRIDDRLRALPGGDRARGGLHDPDGRQLPRPRRSSVDGETSRQSKSNVVSAGYFKMLGTPLTAGRDFDDRDVPGAPLVAIVNESFAQTYLAGGGGGPRFTIPDDREPSPGHELRNHRRRQEPEISRHPRTLPPILYTASSQSDARARRAAM